MKSCQKKNFGMSIVRIAYKKNINDYRESPSLKIFEKLISKKNCSLDVYDPYIKSFRIKIKSIKQLKLKILKIMTVLFY